LKTILVCLLVYLLISVAGALYVHFRGKVRLRLGRQLTEHSGLLSPINCLFYFFSAVPKDPVLPTEEVYPEMAPIRENWEVIRDEALALLSSGQIRASDRHNDLAFVAFYRRGWRRFYLKWYHDWLPSAKQACPRTIELLEDIPSVKAAAFTLLPPGTELGRHRDPFAVALRYHLGLSTPQSDDCAIWIDGEKVSWRDGEDFVFDESYVHWARNDTDQDRLIFFADLPRPLTSRLLAWCGAVFGRYVLRMTRSNNVPEEAMGAFNYVTPAIYRLKLFFTAAKAWNRRVYYSVKMALMVGAGVWAALWLLE
jgi:beta-hydroxylase